MFAVRHAFIRPCFPGFIPRREVCNVLQTSLPDFAIQLDGREHVGR